VRTGEEAARALVRFLIAALCAGALLLILLISSGSDIDEDSARAIGTASAIAFFSLTGVAGLSLAGRRPELAWFGYLTVVASAIATLMMIGTIWSGDDAPWETAFIALILAFAGGHASVLLAPVDSTENLRLVRNGTLLALAVLVTMSTIAIGGGDFGVEPIAIVAVLYALGTVVLALLRRSSPAAAAAPVSGPVGATGGLPLDHLCHVWEGSAETAVQYLRQQGIDQVTGPLQSTGSNGLGRSVYYRDAEGRLIELIAYERG
jgi:hypothetical protein